MINSINSSKQGSIKGWFPRGLVDSAKDILFAPVTSEGLCPLQLHWDIGRVTKIEVIQNYREHSLKLLLPRLIEPHSHIDKSFTWKEFPNLQGTYEEALKVNLREHENRTPEIVRSRSEKALKLALANGLRSIRSHIDSFGLSGTHSWQVITDLKHEWKDFIELQCVALVPLEYWGTQEGHLLANKVARSEGLLGGVLVPPFHKQDSYKSLVDLFHLANRVNCGIDIHIDESAKFPAAGIKQLIKALDHMEVNVPITCSHSSSMSLLSSREVRYLANRLASHNVGVIALPLTNNWLLGRQERETPVKRPLAPIKQLQEAGVNVAIGGDNLQDPWFPLGNLDPISLMSSSMSLIQLPPWERLGLSPYTTSAAAIMGLEWDCTIKCGSPANFVILDASSWSECLSIIPRRQHIINGDFFDENMSLVKPQLEIF